VSEEAAVLGKTGILALLIALAAGVASGGGAPGDGQPAVAVFAGGCFWCMQPAFDAVDGVIKTTVGYTGGHTQHPSYEEVSSGATGHYESVEVEYDPNRVSYAKLLDVFWHNVDPTDSGGQFCDRGDQYRSVIFVRDEAQRHEAESSEAQIEKVKPFPQPIVTRILPASTFWPAEEYHQQYYKKNPIRYKYYRWRCGRDQRLRELWGDAAGGH
jgi:peptide-methionine (S)-S-oxide reductase